MIRVGIVEDHPVTLHGLEAAILAHGELILAATANGYEATREWENPIPEVVILDLVLPGISGPEAVTALRDRGAKVLVLSAFGRRDNVINAMAAGASGYLTKQAEYEEITAAIKVLSRGGSYVSATLAGYLLSCSDEDRHSLGVRLTPRELEVLRLLAQGESDTGIARCLQLSPRTVGGHINSIRRKVEEVYGPVTRTRLTRLYVERARDQ